MVDIVFTDPVSSVLYITAYMLFWLILGGILGFFIGKAIDFVLNNTLEKWIESKKIGKELKEAGLPVSDLLGAYSGLFIFLLFAQLGVSGLYISSSIYNQISGFINLLETIIIALAFVTAGLIFVDFFSDYVYRLAKGYHEDIAEALKLTVFVGFIWVVIYYSIGMLGIQNTLISGLSIGFVALSLGFVITDYINEKIKDKEFSDFMPYARFYILGIFILIAVFAVFSYYINGIGKLVYIFAWGFVALYIIAAIPFIIKAIKELY